MNRTVITKVKGYPTMDGAGVHLIRVLGNTTIHDFNPILMLDSFDSTDPTDYRAGFPMHPHRGIETLTFVEQGNIKHRDTLGFSDTVSNGEVQWMTAGSGILHEEVIPDSPRMLGVQIWMNLPKKDKMCDPNYHAIKRSDIQEIALNNGNVLRLLAGNYLDYQGYQGQHLPLDFYEIIIQPKTSITIPSNPQNSAMVFTLLGKAVIGNDLIDAKTAVALSDGDTLTVEALEEEVHLLYLSAPRLEEDVAWGGPIVMNTREELYHAFDELEQGTFLKHQMHHN